MTFLLLDPSKSDFEDVKIIMLATNLYSCTVQKQGREKDRAVFEDKDAFQLLVKSMRESYRQGGRGVDLERRLLTSSWGFEVDEIPFEGVRLYYGTEDEHTPVTMGRYLAQSLKKAVLTECPGDTHWTITPNRSEDILKDVLLCD